MSKRTEVVKITNEALVLKELREKTSLSMRDAGEKMGYSSSYISQIENGRENPPKGSKLEKFLKVYGVSVRTYRRYVTNYREQVTDLDIITKILPNLNSSQLESVRVLVEHFAKTKV